MVTPAVTEPEQVQPAQKKSILPTVGAGLAAGAVAAPLLYSAIRKPTYSKLKSLADIQKKSKGRFARTIAEEAPTSKLRKWWDKVKYDVDEIGYTGGKAPAKPKKFEGAVHHFDPEFDPKYLKGTVNPIASKPSVDLGERIGEQKWKEYQYFQKHAPGVMPESASMSGVLREMGHRGPLPKSPKERAVLLGKVQGRLRTQHPEGFVMKDVAGAQSAGMFPRETHELAELHRQFGKSGLGEKIKQFDAGNLSASQWDVAFKKLKSDPSYSGRVLDDMFRDPASVMIQKKIPIEQTTGVRRLAGKLIGQPASKELRVHAIGGKVDPSMVTPRYDPTMSIFERKKLKDAATYAQDIVDKLPKKHRNTGFAFDIAPIEGGGFRMIEANPGGASGLLHPEKNPFISPKLRKQITGQWSSRVSGGGAALGSVGVGTGAAIGAHMLGGKTSSSAGVFKGRPFSPYTVKFKTEFQGIPINVDRPKGFIMKGTDDKGEPWSRTYKYDYGYIPRTLGGDDDGLDVFIGPDKKAEESYWAIQQKPDGKFDEYKCILPGQELIGTIVGGSKSFYTGQAVKLRSASGKTLAVTPNHPVLTLRGLIPAGDLKKGDHLLTYDGEGELSGSGDYEQNTPTVVEKVFRSLVEFHPLGVASKFVTPLDFHGDADGFQGEVDVVRTYCELRGDAVPQAVECVQERQLVGPLSTEADLVGSRPLHARFQAEGSPGIGETCPLSGTPSLIVHNLGGPSRFAQAYRFGNSPDGDLALLKSVSDGTDINVETLGDSLRRLTFGISPDQIVDVELVHYSGPVFDFESTSGLILVNRVVVSNCFLGFPNRDAAIGCYKQHIPKKLLNGLVTMKVGMMKSMLRIDPKHPMKKIAFVLAFHDELAKIGEKKSFTQGVSDKARGAFDYITSLRHRGPKGELLKDVEDFAVDTLKKENLI